MITAPPPSPTYAFRLRSQLPAYPPHRFHMPSLHNQPTQFRQAAPFPKKATEKVYGRRLVVRGCQEEEKNKRRSFLSLEEAGLVEISGLGTHERFLCRLTISSLNLLKVVAEQEGVPIEELNAGRVCDWFLKDKLKREQNLNSAVLQWDDSDFQI